MWTCVISPTEHYDELQKQRADRWNLVMAAHTLGSNGPETLLAIFVSHLSTVFCIPQKIQP